uniref:Uncharacterized protein n=1 Tax=Amblyomma aureolatum TaxID=187763 RepID=A0A1E1X1F5_9ACAR
MLQAIVICFSLPQPMSGRSTTTEPNVSVEKCNQTCNPSRNETCSDGCICFLLNREKNGTCYTIDLGDYVSENDTPVYDIAATPISVETSVKK